MTNSIPASALVNVIPGVLGAGGNPLSLNAVFLTADPSIPQGTAQPFPTLASVSNWFGPNAIETTMAAVYFNGFIGCEVLPGLLYFANYNASAAAAYLRGGSVAALTLAALQALSGTLIITVNGEVVTSASINLSAATSFSNAASLIQTGLDSSGDIFSGTASTSGSSTTLTIATTVSGALHVGDVIAGTGITGGTTIASIGTYNGVSGTVILSAPMTVASSTPVTVSSTATCTYDALRQAFVITSPTTGAVSTIGFATGTLAAGLLLTSALGAVTSQGAAAATAAGVMNGIIAVTQNWATFTTTWEPILSVKLAFAAWVTAQNQRYTYVCYDSDVTALAANASGSFGVLTATYTGVVAIWNPSGLIAAFFCGATASINFSETNGRITYAFKGQAGLVPDITTASSALNLISNGYSFYGSYATANQQFQQYQNGAISGVWKWADTYINQIWLNSNFQLALMELLANTKSVPYVTQGYHLIRAALLDPIHDAKTFGAIQSGVELSNAQIAEVNQAAGLAIDGALFQAGWYLQILDPGAIVRGGRGSPVITFWYTDAGSVQKINMASIDVM